MACSVLCNMCISPARGVPSPKVPLSTLADVDSAAGLLAQADHPIG